MERTSNKLMIWIRCVTKERHAKYAERGGARTGIENLWFRGIDAWMGSRPASKGCSTGHDWHLLSLASLQANTYVPVLNMMISYRSSRVTKCNLTLHSLHNFLICILFQKFYFKCDVNLNDKIIMDFLSCNRHLISVSTSIYWHELICTWGDVAWWIWFKLPPGLPKKPSSSISAGRRIDSFFPLCLFISFSLNWHL